MQASVCFHLSGEGGDPNEATRMEGPDDEMDEDRAARATQLEARIEAIMDARGFRDGAEMLEATRWGWLDATLKLEASDELEATVGKEKVETTAGSHQELAFSDDDSVQAVRKRKGGKKSSGSEEAPAVVVRRRTARLTSTAVKPKTGEKAAEPKGTWHCHKDATGTIHSCPLAKGVTFSEPQSKTPFLSIPF